MSSVMEQVSGLFSRLKARKQNEQKDKHKTLRSLIVAFHDGEEVDESEVLAIMEIAGLTEGQLKDEIESYAKRVRWANEMKVYADAQASIPRLEALLEKAKQELEEATKPLQEKVGRAYTAWKQANDLATMKSTPESHLIHSCKDPAILNEEAELSARFKELREEADFLDNRDGKLLQLYDYHLRRIADEQEKIGLVDSGKIDGSQLREIKKSLSEHTQEAASRESQAKQTRKRLAEIDAEQKRIQARRTQLHLMKLIP